MNKKEHTGRPEHEPADQDIHDIKSLIKSNNTLDAEKKIKKLIN